MKELKVSAIENGTVIDHISCKNIFQILKILNLNNHKNIISLATNIESKKLGQKAILKVSEKNLDKKELEEISLLAPNATISIIKDYNIINKFKLDIPEKIENIIKCNNPKCITNIEKVNTKFNLVDKDKLIYKCHYCERNIDQNNLDFI